MKKLAFKKSVIERTSELQPPGAMSITNSSGRRTHRGDDTRRMEYFEIVNLESGRRLSNFVPNPLTESDSCNLSSGGQHQIVENKKLGIYKSCNSKMHVVQECPPESHGVRCLNFSNDGEVLLLGYYCGSLQGFRSSDGSIFKTYIVSRLETCPVTSIKCHPKPSCDGIFFASCAQGKIKMLSISHDKPTEDLIKEKNNEILSLDVNLTGKTMITGGKDATIRLYDTETLKVMTSYSRNFKGDPEKKTAGFHVLRIFVVRYHPDNENVFISGGWDSLVKIWDVRTPTGCVETIIGPHISGDSIDVKRNTLLTGSFTPNEGLQLWDLRTAKRIKSCNPPCSARIFEGHFITAAQFFNGDPLGDVILSANVSVNALDVISIKLNAVLQSFTSSEPVSAVKSHDTQIAFGDMGHQMYIGTFNMAGVTNSKANSNL